MSGQKKRITYKNSGVDIDAGMKTLDLIKKEVRSTATGCVLSGLGAFGGMYDLSEIVKNYREPVLVQSVDGVGTKLMVATMAGYHTTVGEDIVNHGCNDVLCQGAKPITFLDYIAMSKLDPAQAAQIVKGMAKACREAGVSILGGETAELPGMYRDNEYDIAGIVTGVVEKDEIVSGSSIAAGNILVGLASNGLHTNGYSLARKVLFETAGLGINDTPDGLDTTVGEALLMPHINYAPAVLKLLKKERVLGMAHITGGGLRDNLMRILPEMMWYEVKPGSWPVPPIFGIIEKLGNVPTGD
ncbi:MAG: phosphoribosylformylglycinamidine cyclo-ligase, partial [Nitrospinota bacterium]